MAFYAFDFVRLTSAEAGQATRSAGYGDQPFILHRLELIWEPAPHAFAEIKQKESPEAGTGV